jgi:hypothetical protein
MSCIHLQVGYCLGWHSRRAKLDAFFEWAWDYFGRVHVSPVLDRRSVDWAPEEPTARDHLGQSLGRLRSP